MYRIFIVIVLAALTLSSIKGIASETPVLAVTQAEASFQTIGTISKAGCEGCSGCDTNKGGLSLPFREFPFVITTIALLVLLLVKKNKLKVLFWSVGITLSLGLAGTLALKQTSKDKDQKDCKAIITQQGIPASQPDSLKSDEEFLPIDSSNEFEPISKTDEFLAVSTDDPGNNGKLLSTGERSNLIRTLIALFAAVIAGFTFRYSKGRNFRSVFLLTSLVYLGFYSSGCPCMISSFQNLILFLLGEPTSWITLVWMMGLLPITYFFGKIWCGWVCHLGAVQEFLYLPGKAKIILNPSWQKTFKIIRLTAFILLAIQLVLTRSNLYCKIDPFKVIFNLQSANLTGYILLAVLLISSLLIYRPFCRALCPVGLVLGWVEKIPGASLLQVEAGCKNCNQCQKRCNYQAILVSEKKTIIENCECIRCGDCIDSCRFEAIRNK